MALWAIVFLAAFFLDVAWAIYTRHVVAHNAGWATLWTGVVMLLSGFNVIIYTEDHWLLIPAAAGAALGTYLATSRPLTKLKEAVERSLRHT